LNLQHNVKIVDVVDRTRNPTLAAPQVESTLEFTEMKSAILNLKKSTNDLAARLVTERENMAAALERQIQIDEEAEFVQVTRQMEMVNVIQQR
jgi:hypothetical protein